jgi:transporter family-2 protein
MRPSAMAWSLTILALAAGALLPLQALVNARLGAGLGSPLWAAVVQNLVGAAAMLLLIAALRPALPNWSSATTIPAWTWFGGALGMVFVATGLLAAPRLGAAPTMAIVIVGQLASALALDAVGLLHERRPITAANLAGVLLLAAGAALVLRRAR